MLILRILRRANPSTTTTYYIKGAADEVIYAMKMQVTNLELTSPIVNGHLEVGGGKKQEFGVAFQSRDSPCRKRKNLF